MSPTIVAASDSPETFLTSSVPLYNKKMQKNLSTITEYSKEPIPDNWAEVFEKEIDFLIFNGYLYNLK